MLDSHVYPEVVTVRKMDKQKDFMELTFSGEARRFTYFLFD
jgi:hypothetical protein